MIDIQKSNPLGKTITLNISGLISAPDTLYTDYKYINVVTLTDTEQAIDSGQIRYNISCNENLIPFSCRTCENDGKCLSCYTNDNLYLSNDICTNNCSNLTSFQRLYYSKHF